MSDPSPRHRPPDLRPPAPVAPAAGTLADSVTRVRLWLVLLQSGIQDETVVDG